MSMFGISNRIVAVKWTCRRALIPVIPNMSLFEYIKQLFANQLYEDVVQAVRVYFSNIARIKEQFGVANGAAILFYYASSLSRMKEFPLALEVYKNILACYTEHFATFKKVDNKPAVKRKSTGDVGGSGGGGGGGGGAGAGISGDDWNEDCVINTIEIKYQMHLCHKELGQFKSALNILLSISKESMSLRLWLALADLHHHFHQMKEAIDCYTAVILKNPLALFTLKRYLKCVPPSAAEEFVKLLSQKLSEKLPAHESAPLVKLIKAHVCAQQPKNYAKASQMFFDLRSANTSSVTPFDTTIYIPDKRLTTSDNPYMLLETARYLYYEGYISNASYFFKIVYANQPDLFECIDCYAACLYRDGKSKQLQHLASHVLASCTSADLYRQRSVKKLEQEKPTLLNCDSNSLLTRPELWIVLGYQTLMKKDPKAILFAEKAHFFDPRNEEALVLKALIYGKKLGEMLPSPHNNSNESNVGKNHIEFIGDVESFLYHTKQNRSSLRFEVLKYLAEAILIRDGKENALNYVKDAFKRHGTSARVCAFYFTLSILDPNSTSADRTNGIRMLEEAVKLKPYYLSAIISLAKVYIEQGTIDSALKLLLRASQKFDYHFIDQMIIECYYKMKKEEEAVQYQTTRCSKNPTDVRRISVEKLKEENLTELMTELDLHSISFINPSGGGGGDSAYSARSLDPRLLWADSSSKGDSLSMDLD